MSRIFIVVISLLMLAGCRKGSEPIKQAKKNSDLDMRFEEVYAAWKLKEEEFKHYGKTTPIKQHPEYTNFLSLGSESVPKLREKVSADDGYDFVLCDVIIDLKGWSPDEFEKGDYGRRARQVLSKLGGPSSNSIKPVPPTR